jgi:hypothetical protein
MICLTLSLLIHSQFHAFNADFPVLTSISSFTVLVAKIGGRSQTYDNNGKGFPVSDGVIVQTPQSCVSNGKLNVLAAVRSLLEKTLELCLLNTDPKQCHNVSQDDRNPEGATKRRGSNTVSCTFPRLVVSIDGTRGYDRSIHAVQCRFNNFISHRSQVWGNKWLLFGHIQRRGGSWRHMLDHGHRYP